MDKRREYFDVVPDVVQLVLIELEVDADFLSDLLGQGIASDILGHDGVVDDLAVPRGEQVGSLMARVKADPGCDPGCDEGEVSGVLEIERRHFESFEGELNQALFVGLVLLGCFGEEERRPLEVDLHFVEEVEGPELLELLDAGDGAVPDGVECLDVAESVVGFLADVHILDNGLVGVLVLAALVDHLGLSHEGGHVVAGHLLAHEAELGGVGPGVDDQREPELLIH